MEFFRVCTGKWYSQRVSHHLAFRRQERGESEITICCLEPDHPEVVALCTLHGQKASQSLGGALVTWRGVMQADELNHDGRSLLVPIPDLTGDTEGALLRDLGYAEIVPVAGRYRMGTDGSLYLATKYQDTESEERFWFGAGNANVRFRSSALKRWGGLSMATYCTEIRLAPEESFEHRPQGADLQARLGTQGEAALPKVGQSYSPWGG